MELTMLLLCLLLIKMGINDALTFHVSAYDCYGLLLLSLFHLQKVEIISFLVVTTILCLLVYFQQLGNGDRDCLIILMLVQSFHMWIIMILFSSILALFYALIKHKTKIPFIFFLSLGHFLNFYLKTL